MAFQNLAVRWHAVKQRRGLGDVELVRSEFPLVGGCDLDPGVVGPHLKAQANAQNRNAQVKNFAVKRRQFVGLSRATGKDYALGRNGFYIGRRNRCRVGHQAKHAKSVELLLD